MTQIIIKPGWIEQGEQECYIEVENVESTISNEHEKRLNSVDTVTSVSYRPVVRNQSVGLSGQLTQTHPPPPPSPSSTSSSNLLNVFNYTGILYTQTEKKHIQLKLKDFYSNNNSILLTGKIPG